MDNASVSKQQATASSLADRLIVSDDNPRHEDPAEITAQILAGMQAGTACEVLHDRRSAIEAAISAAADDDVVLVAGKGHESIQWIGAEALPFHDAQVARHALDRWAETGRVE